MTPSASPLRVLAKTYANELISRDQYVEIRAQLLKRLQESGRDYRGRSEELYRVNGSRDGAGSTAQLHAIRLDHYYPGARRGSNPGLGALRLSARVSLRDAYSKPTHLDYLETESGLQDGAERIVVGDDGNIQVEADPESKPDSVLRLPGIAGNTVDDILSDPHPQ